MSNEWFERGELPPSQTRCEMFVCGKWIAVYVVAIDCANNLLVVREESNGDYTGRVPKAEFYRPIKTDKEKAVEAALSVMSTKTISNTQRKTINKLYDAGLLRLPEDKK